MATILGLRSRDATTESRDTVCDVFGCFTVSIHIEARCTKPRSLLAFAHRSVTCLSEVRLLDTHTPRSFSVSPDSKGVRSKGISCAVRVLFLQVIR